MGPAGRGLAALAMSLAPSAGMTQTAPPKYRFEAVEATIERGVGRSIRVRAVTELGAPVAGMEVTDASVDRSPDGIPAARLPAFYTPSLDYGVYHLRADLPTDGVWALQFSARVPGEKQLVPARVTFRVVGPGAGRSRTSNSTIRRRR